jgi:hypothetical protein
MSISTVPTTGPTGTTFSSLETDLRSYAERGGSLDADVEAQIPRVINNTERDLADRLKIQGYLAPYASKMKIGQPRISKPSNWRSTVSINFGTGPTLSRRKSLRGRSYEYVRAIYAENGQLGEPALYADYDEKHWLFLPGPNMAYPFEAMVWRLPDMLSPSNQTNYLTELAPTLLLYTCLQALCAFLKDPANSTMWKSFADERFTNITGQDLKRMTDRAQVRSTN